MIARLVATDHTRHHSADDAIVSLVKSGQLRPVRSGAFWYRHTFRDRAALQEWVDERDDWTFEKEVPRGRITLRRAVEFTHFRRV